MTVVEGWFAGKVHQSVPEVDDLPPNVVEVLKINMAVNSKAFLLEKEDTANARVSRALRTGTRRGIKMGFRRVFRRAVNFKAFLLDREEAVNARGSMQAVCEAELEEAAKAVLLDTPCCPTSLCPLLHPVAMSPYTNDYLFAHCFTLA